MKKVEVTKGDFEKIYQSLHNNDCFPDWFYPRYDPPVLAGGKDHVNFQKNRIEIIDRGCSFGGGRPVENSFVITLQK